MIIPGSWHEFHNRGRLRRWIDELKGQLIFEILGQIEKNSFRKLHYEPSNTKTSIDLDSKERPTSLISKNEDLKLFYIKKKIITVARYRSSSSY